MMIEMTFGKIPQDLGYIVPLVCKRPRNDAERR